MPRLHLIERADGMVPIDRAQGLWESGNWVMSSDTARSLVGGQVYFHKRQADRSHFGGEITGFRVLGDEHPEVGRVVIEFKPSNAGKNVLAGAGGWGMEMKIVP